MKSRIQIIDDNVALTTLLAKALAKFGYEPVVENNPLLAVNTVRHYMPDLILLDVMMPERDGGRVLMDLRNDLSLRYIPVVLLTAIAREAQALANTGGIQSLVLAKPVQLQELLSVIDSQLHANLSFNQLQDSATKAFQSHPPHSPIHSHNELPNFDQEVPWAEGSFAPSTPVTPPSTMFGGGFPAREQSPGGLQSPFSFPGRTDDDTLPG
jgi:CheY-like chemotaxis protein